jgi:hypothetical protein
MNITQFWITKLSLPLPEFNRPTIPILGQPGAQKRELFVDPAANESDSEPEGQIRMEQG